MAENFFGGLGMDFDAVAEARKQRQLGVQRSLGLVDRMGYDNPADKGAANIGAALGAGLTSGSGLTPQQEQFAAIQKEANESAKNWAAENPDAAEDDKAIATQDIWARSLIKGGRSDLGSQILQQTAEAKRTKELQAKNLELLGINIDTNKFKLAADKAGPNTAVWVRGEKDPNASFNVLLDPVNGTATDASTGRVFKPGEYTTRAPLDPERNAYLKHRLEIGKTDGIDGALDADGKYLAAVRYMADGKLPPGAGKESTKVKMEILSWAAHLAKDSTWRPKGFINEDGVDVGLNFNDAYRIAMNPTEVKLAGNPTIAVRSAQLNALPTQLEQLSDITKDLKFPGNPLAAEAKAAYYKQVGDPKFQSYLARRADILLEITSALRSRGATDKATEIEKKAQGDYMSPAKFEAWMHAQLAAIDAQSEILDERTVPNMRSANDPSQPAAPPATKPKTVKFGDLK